VTICIHSNALPKQFAKKNLKRPGLLGIVAFVLTGMAEGWKVNPNNMEELK